MADYEKMYYKLFNRVTDTIEQLKAAQKEAEDIYIFSEEMKGEEQKAEEE